MEATPNIIVRIHRPELTEEERARRMATIKAAATRLLTAVARQQAAAKQTAKEHI